MAPNFSKIVTKQNAFAVSGAALAVCLYTLRQRSKLTKKRGRIVPKVEEEVKYLISEKKEATTKAHVDKQFMQQLINLLKIIIPGWNSKESGLLVLVAGSLVLRSLCDLWMINNGTRLESAIISMNKPLFVQRLIKFIIAMPLISVINQLLKYSIGSLKIRLRTNMTRRLYDDYLKNFTYYRMSQLDNRIANADQLLTTDVDKFCESVAELYCNVAKPTLDIGIYVYRCGFVVTTFILATAPVMKAMSQQICCMYRLAQGKRIGVFCPNEYTSKCENLLS